MAEKKAGPSKVSKPDRLFNLTCALLYTSKGLSKKEILQSVRGYDVEYVDGGDNSSLERKFERDKKSLRHNGIQLEAKPLPHDDDNNQASVYRIKRESFSWPEDVKLTPRQMALLNLAAEAWAGGSLSTAANRGITKLRAMGVVGEHSDIVGIAPRIQAHEPSFRDLNNAISDCQVVQFEYRKPDTGEIMTRTLQPWVLHQVAGSWLVMGLDELRQDTRNFMLRRIVSKVRTLSSAKDENGFEPPAQDLIDKAVKELDDLAKAQVAVVRIQPDSEAWFRYEMDLISDRTSDEIEINYHDIYVLAEQLREYANQIEVQSPEKLVQLIQTGFKKVADLHG